MTKELTTTQAAELLGVSRDTIERWVKQGKLSARRGGFFPGRTNPILIPEKEISKLLKRLNEQARG